MSHPDQQEFVAAIKSVLPQYFRDVRVLEVGSLDINGTVNGGTISFGTVGSQAITYSGSVSGDSMSGTYEVQSGGGSAGGSWSATKDP